MIELHIDAEGLLKSTGFGSCIVITGKVGSGKTLCLTAITMGVLAPSLTDNAIERLLPVTKLTKQSDAQNSIVLKVEAEYFTLPLNRNDDYLPLNSKTINKRHKDKSTISATAKSDQEWCELVRDQYRCFMLAYGPRIGDRFYSAKDLAQYEQYWAKRNAMRLEGVINPSNERLVPLETWLKPLKETDNTRYIEVINLINQLLGISDYWFSGEYCRQSGKYLFDYKRYSKSINEVSTGTRELLAFICDFVFHIHQSTSKGNDLKNITGMVLIDQFERNFDKHIKSSFLPLLRKLLPNIQFIITTHSDEVLASAVGAAKLRLNIDKTRTIH